MTPDRSFRQSGRIGISSSQSQSQAPAPDALPERLRQSFERTIDHLLRATSADKVRYRDKMLDICQRLLATPGGRAYLYEHVGLLDQAGLFEGSDWEDPSVLSPGLVGDTLSSADPPTAVLEMVSEIRLLAVANGDLYHRGMIPDQARHFLTQVLALNLNRFLTIGGEAERARDDALADLVDEQFAYLKDNVGLGDILGKLIEEIWRIMDQRPIQVDQVKIMISQIAVAMQGAAGDASEGALGADRLVSALFGPTTGCREDPGLPVYEERLAAMDSATLQHEAAGFARAMHDTGLVSDYHTVFVRWLVAHGEAAMLPTALGLSSTGIDCLRCYQDLIHHLILETISPDTSQTVYALAMMLERGVLYIPPVGPALWRQSGLRLTPAAAQRLTAAYGPAVPPEMRLLAGVINLLGLPLGVGQGNNPTCQSARALSMWAYSDPDYLLYLVAQAAVFDDVIMRFEGQPIYAAAARATHAPLALMDVDPVSVVLVPLLNGVYEEMGRLCEDRGEDPHRWINREFHGWWVGGEFNIAVDVTDGALIELRSFLERFWATYHPLYNGNQPVIHPQPAGIAVTDSAARFIGWHAITILRVAMDQARVMRVYFFNPNNDSGQNWGNGVEVSTHGHGEHNGEASLPFVDFASRLYIFHADPLQRAGYVQVPEEELDDAMVMVRESWGAEREER
ncbi:MAG: hypothetical protein U5Q16_14200 [Gammaproteobacteria bacterium]|nr:hypothetical protein [Gammaproteobacteria bacterium]